MFVGSVMSIFLGIKGIPEPGPLVSEVSANPRSRDRRRQADARRQRQKPEKKDEPEQIRESPAENETSRDVDRYV